MTEKSYVSMETNICVVCGKEYDTGSLLLDKRLRESMERHTCTGWGMCEEHEEKRQEGYIAVVGIDEGKTPTKAGGDRIDPQDAYRTGFVMHVKPNVWDTLFNETPIPDKGVIFCPQEYLDHLEKQIVIKDTEA